MKKRVSIVSLIALVGIITLCTSCTATKLDKKSVPVSASWKYHEGTNSSWYAPDFDDQSWKTVTDLSQITFGGFNNYFTLRATLTVPQEFNNIPLWLGFKKFNAAVDLYADGVLIGNRGSMPPAEIIKVEEEKDILIPANCIHDGKVQITMKVYLPVDALKDPDLHFENTDQATFIRTVKTLLSQQLFVLMAVASIFFIFYSALQYFIDSRDIAYIYFCLSVTFIIMYFVELGGMNQLFPYNFQRPFFRSCLGICMCFLLLFLNRFFDRKHYKVFKIVCFTTAAVLCGIFLANGGKEHTIENLFLVSLVVVVSTIVYGFMCTIRAIRQGEKDNIPILIGFILGTLIAIHDIAYQATGTVPFMWIQGIAFFVLDLSIFLTLAIRQLKSKRKAELLAKETAEQRERLSQIIENAQHIASDSNSIARELNESVLSVINASEQTQAKINDINIAIQEQNKIREATDTAVHNLTDFLTNISNGFDTETEIITKTVNQTQEVINGITKVGEGITTAAQFTSSLSHLTRLSSDDTKRLLKVIEDIQSSSNEILGVVTTLDTFAGKIDLLSMNASIEAAHSGAAGKGFSVIAHEIKSLASQTQQWSARIGEIITTVIGSIEESVHLTEKVNNALSEINEGSIQSAEKVNSAADGIRIQESAGNAISHDSKELFQSATEMQKDVQNQKKFSNIVLGNMMSLSIASNSVDAASLEIAKESELLNAEAQKLRDMARRTTESAERLLQIMEN